MRHFLKCDRHSREGVKLLRVCSSHLLYHRIGVQQYALTTLNTLIKPREGEREGERGGGRERGREREREGGREGGRERGRKGESE